MLLLNRLFPVLERAVKVRMKKKGSSLEDIPMVYKSLLSIEEFNSNYVALITDSQNESPCYEACNFLLTKIRQTAVY